MQGDNMKKPKKQTDLRENIGRILIDCGKLIFAGLFLGGVLRGEIPHLILIVGGFTFAIIFCSIGLWAVSKEKKSEER